MSSAPPAFCTIRGAPQRVDEAKKGRALWHVVACHIVSSVRRADVLRWVRGQQLAQRRIAREARARKVTFGEALDRVDELRSVASDLKAATSRARAQRENLAFHSTWQRVRRAYGLG